MSCLVQTEEESNIIIFKEATEPCLCDSDAPGSSVALTASKVLFINRIDPEKETFFNAATNELGEKSLITLDKDFSFTKLIKYMLPINGKVNYNQFARSYLDGYLGVPSNLKLEGELNDVRSRSIARGKIFNEWSPIGNEEAKVLTPDSSSYKLLAVLFRPDLIEKDAAGNLLHAGEFRFIFNFVTTDSTAPSLQKNHVIFEYKLPLETATLNGKDVGALSRNGWNTFIGKLQCLNGQEYIDHLVNIVNRVTKAKFSGPWVNGSALGQLRVNDFLAPHDDEDITSAPWSMFEFRLASTGLLQRHRMPKTPKDNFASFNAGPPTQHNPGRDRILREGLVTRPGEIEKWFISNFSKIVNPDSDYNLDPKQEAWQVDYGRSASWIKPFEGQSIGPASASEAQQSFVKNRFSINTCNSCHGGHFQDQSLLTPDLATTSKLLGIDDNDFAGIENQIDFVHVDENGEPSEFLALDLINRRDELEFQLSVGNCMEQ